MRPILLSCALLALLAVPTATAASASAPAKPGYLVVRRAFDDGGVNGRPVATIVIQGFVLGRISAEGKVDIFQRPSPTGNQGAAQVTGTDLSVTSIRWHRFNGKRYTGSNLRFRVIGGTFRVVVRGSGVFLFAGGHGQVTLRGSHFSPRDDGKYSVNAGTPRSLPTKPLALTIGGG